VSRTSPTDDANTFDTEDQVTAESIALLRLLLSYIAISVRRRRDQIRDRPPVATARTRSGTATKRRCAMRSRSAVVLHDSIPEGPRFYGPKTRIRIARCAGPRVAMRHVAQLDFVLPGAARCGYVGRRRRSGTVRKLHRAILGSHRALHGVLIEALRRPLSDLARRVADRVASITSEAWRSTPGEVAGECSAAGLRVVLDTANEKLNYKVREHSLAKVPSCGCRRTRGGQTVRCVRRLRRQGAGGSCARRTPR